VEFVPRAEQAGEFLGTSPGPGLTGRFGAVGRRYVA